MNPTDAVRKYLVTLQNNITEKIQEEESIEFTKDVWERREGGGGESRILEWWFGGGYDLTPYYGFQEDVIHWHQCAKDACDPFGQNLYQQFKTQCDEYFYLKHREEPRGVGGVFFDDYNDQNFEHSFALTQSIGDSFLPAYIPILEKRKERKKSFH